MHLKNALSFSVVLFLAALLLSPAAWGETREMRLESTAFSDGASIPNRYTCDAQDVSPPLRWSGLPEGTKSLALIVDDPDAPGGTWVHWVYYDIPADRTELPEGVPPRDHPNLGGTQGRNDFNKIGYGGPCPPGGTHRYFFKLYALDTQLGLPPGATKSEVLQNIEGHVMGQSALMGKYER